MAKKNELKKLKPFVVTYGVKGKRMRKTQALSESKKKVAEEYMEVLKSQNSGLKKSDFEVKIERATRNNIYIGKFSRATFVV